MSLLFLVSVIVAFPLTILTMGFIQAYYEIDDIYDWDSIRFVFIWFFVGTPITMWILDKLFF